MKLLALQLTGDKRYNHLQWRSVTEASEVLASLRLLKTPNKTTKYNNCNIKTFLCIQIMNAPKSIMEPII